MVGSSLPDFDTKIFKDMSVDLIAKLSCNKLVPGSDAHSQMNLRGRASRFACGLKSFFEHDLRVLPMFMNSVLGCWSTDIGEKTEHELYCTIAQSLSKISSDGSQPIVSAKHETWSESHPAIRAGRHSCFAKVEVNSECLRIPLLMIKVG